MAKINPRPIFRRAIELLAMAECPHCHRALGTKDLIMNRTSYHCSWCASREKLVAEYKDWLREDSAKAPRPSAGA